ncbi:Haem-binding domain-containing protein [Bryocella elongata]|uniref:Haem-binding domain-containing protein n=1 Tax=Bryocella elongata TaxID=863522 RepID=A0A1H6BKE4_9BACT|nr:cytochrome P460 family protein [Bryocella elongata]SEG60676.1 Haem-binding domain-containing protein [Bryocella elongata]
MKRSLLTLALAGVVALLAAQAIRPSLGTPAGPQAEIAAPPEVRAILERRCYACHSDTPKLEWYDQIAPPYWIVAKDVRNARAHLNFSEIGARPAGAQRATLFEAVNMIQLGAMPLPSYLAVHRDAGVTPAELATLKAYLAPFTPSTSPTPATPPPASSTATERPAGPSLNGVPFPADYKSWKIVSTTDRGDNHTLRLITGNDIAVKAIEAGNISPWPNGAAIAKIAVQAVDDGKGHITAGNFIQVEFMEKDAEKYKSTQGWGYARFRGNDLKPYGADAHFDQECTGCHAPMHDHDYVYSMPLPRGGGAQ